MLIPVAIVNQTSVAPPPSSPVSGMLAWYDASVVASITTVSDAVSQWNDQSGNGNTLTQGTAGDRPLYGGAGARTINGITAVEFVSNDFLASAVDRSSRTQTTFVVGVVDSLAAVRTMLGVDSATGGNQFRLETTGLVDTLKETVIGLFASNHVAITLPFVVCQQLSGTAITHWQAQSGNVELYKESLAEATAFTAGKTLRVGVRVTTEGWDGLMGEIIIYNSTLSNDDVALNISYLRNKWGLADVL